MTKPKTFQEAAYLAAKETADLVIKKQKDYGPGNIVALGEVGIFVRLWDKINRMLTLLWEPWLAGHAQEAQNEPLDDTWDDIPGYCLCRKMLRRGWFELPIEEQEEATLRRCSNCGNPMDLDIAEAIDGNKPTITQSRWRCPGCGFYKMETRVSDD